MKMTTDVLADCGLRAWRRHQWTSCRVDKSCSPLNLVMPPSKPFRYLNVKQALCHWEEAIKKKKEYSALQLLYSYPKNKNKISISNFFLQYNLGNVSDTETRRKKMVLFNSPSITWFIDFLFF